jgi:cobyrinic acid a,c-diamide synthase
MNTMTATCKTPRLLLAAPQSGSGKTTLFCGILRALLNKGIRAAAFKSGPDYIDPMFHAQVVGAPSRNLDIFLTGKENVRRLFAKNADGKDLALLEGAMGFYDGMADSTDGSAYDLARTVQAPVVLIVNGKGAALSLAAMVKGFKEFRPDSGIRGVILNNVTKMAYQFYKKTLEQETGVRFYGYFPRLVDAGLESRHLGLVTAGEVGNLESLVARWAAQAAESIDLDGLLELARTAEPLPYEPLPLEPLGQVRIAVARDKAFCFYYQDALDLLAALGAEIVPFSPLTDSHLPDCDGIYIGGGYPELYAAQLAANTSLRTELREKLAGGLPCYAECGGFMYLMEGFRDGDKEYPWVGAVQGHCWMTKRLVRFGYVHLTAQEDNVLCPAGGTIAAHEFHYSDSDANGASFVAVKARRTLSWPCAQATKTLYAGYPHIHLWGNPEFAKNFVRACVQYQGKGVRK